MDPMADRKRRTDALSKEKIVEAAIEILDTEGEKALTFRALTTRLATGAGAIYWHVANKDELLEATTDEVIARVLTEIAGDAEPQEAIRELALGIFDAIDAHPWIGAQLSRAPWQSAMLSLIGGIAEPLQALGLPEKVQSDCGSALLNYILGVAGQNAAHARLLPAETDRAEFLKSVAARWAERDPAKYPFLGRMAEQLVDHDDREQFLVGIDLILAGAQTLRAT
jgi:AcrR family transcriptional regulator